MSKQPEITVRKIKESIQESLEKQRSLRGKSGFVAKPAPAGQSGLKSLTSQDPIRKPEETGGANRTVEEKIISIALKYKNVINRIPWLNSYARNLYYSLKMQRGSIPLSKRVRGIPVVGSLLWWVYMFLKTPSKIVDLHLKIEQLEAQKRTILASINKLAAKSDALNSQIDWLLEIQEPAKIPDDVYAALEDAYRGTREQIKQRVAGYIPYLREARAGTPESLIIDVGCGRGEWLELLKEEGLFAKGVDQNKVAIQKAGAQGLDVVESDAIKFLRMLPPNSVGAVTGFHIVEHLPMKALISLLDESMRVLRQGGLVIFETPNPENIIVGSCSFYIDPTHRNPIPPPTLSLLVENRGFRRVKVLKLSPLNLVNYSGDESLKPIIDRFNLGQDYAIIGHKL